MYDDDVEITEITTLQATKVSGVGAPANGTPFLLLKAAAAADDAEDKDPLAENRKRMKEGKPLLKKSDSAEADALQAELTDEVAKDLSAAQREKMPASSFAYVDKNGGKHLPIHDEGHVIAAKGRVANQDFSEAKTSADSAKKKAEGKIDAKAKALGIGKPETAAAKGSAQDNLNGTATPEENGHLATGQSSVAGSVTAGTKPAPSTIPTDGEASSQPGLTRAYQGGEATVVIPDEAKVNTNLVTKVAAVASLVEAISTLDAQRTAIKDGVAAPPPPASGEPGSAPWESYDSATLAQVAQSLAGCCNAIDSIREREAIEAASNPGDYEDTWDLEEAATALSFAMGVAARLAFSEAAEATKNLDIDQLVDVRNNFDDAIEAIKASPAGETADEEIIHMADVTKDELADTVAASAVAAVEAAFKAKAEKEKQEADEVAEAAKNANNGGDISEADIKPTKEVDADNIDAVKSEAVDPVTKQMADQLEAVTKGLESLQETVTKFAKLPRSGGPSLDGQARGAHPAAEGRQSDVTKSDSDSEIETLEKSLADEKDPLMKDELGRKLTYARLMKMHETGQL